PVFAATEAFGCTSSMDSREIVTRTPVALVKASMSFTKASSSDWTKYFHRSMESCAPRSGCHGAVCAQALAHSGSAGPWSAPAAAAAVPAFTNERRVCKVMAVPPFLAPLPVPPNWNRGDCLFLSLGYPVSRRFVEQVHELRIGLEPDPIAWLEL